MKKSIAFLVVTLLLGILPMMGTNVTNNPEHLVFGKKWMEGGCRAKLVQLLHVVVTNTGDKDYLGYWKYYSRDKSEVFFLLGEVIVPAGETKDITKELYFFEPGNYDLSFESIDTEKALFNYSVKIGEYVAPKVKGTIRLDNLERTDYGNILYGDFAHFRITGTVTITNEGEDTVFGWSNFVDGGGDGIQVVVRPWFGNDNAGYPWFYGLGHELKGGQTITKDFAYEFKAMPEDDKLYNVLIDVLGNTVASIPFTVKQCTNTYWTADGRVKPLPVGPDQVLKIPDEALAVDLRGQYEMNTIFSIDITDANPNCLYYLGYLDNVPQGFTSEANVIRNYEAKTLVIDAEHDYYCPMPFKAKDALFHYTPPIISIPFIPESPANRQNMSSTVVLPFEAEHVCLTALNGGSDSDVGTFGDDLKVYRYKGDDKKYDYLYFEPLVQSRKSGLDAYEPYLIYQQASPVVFYSEEVMVPATREAVVGSDSIRFVGSTVAIHKEPGDDIFQWSCDERAFILNSYGNVLPPFSGNIYLDQSYMDEASTGMSSFIMSLHVMFLEFTSAGIETPQLTGGDHLSAVFSLSGQRVGTASYRDGKMTVRGVRPGLYIVGGRKVVVK